ncbi:Efflux ABC transporter, ATP-binding protein [hydrothermal vent metagenome]|uniref:Efflux ABC transporter, ATP-binding protein n=1 Tax=hydrothermal vent metagenome TaxID=652676 RepID=A0A3B0ZU43_9ZZZZ
MTISIKDLSKSYGDIQALCNINLEISGGGIIGLLGPNGAGKTTLVETLEGLRKPSSGQVSVLGLDPVSDAYKLREQLGVQLQSTAVPLELTPLETLKLIASFFQHSIDPYKILQQVSLTSKAKVRNQTLSGGEKLRLAIGMSLINDPKLIILDEPSSGLDPVSRRNLHTLLSELSASKRCIIFTTHYIEEAEQLCDRIIILNSGKIVADGSPLELIENAGANSTILLRTQGDFDTSGLQSPQEQDHLQDERYQRFTTTTPSTAILTLAESLKSGKGQITELHIKPPSLEDIYFDFIGASRNEIADEMPKENKQ